MTLYWDWVMAFSPVFSKCSISYCSYSSSLFTNCMPVRIRNTKVRIVIIPQHSLKPKKAVRHYLLYIQSCIRTYCIGCPPPIIFKFIGIPTTTCCCYIIYPCWGCFAGYNLGFSGGNLLGLCFLGLYFTVAKLSGSSSSASFRSQFQRYIRCVVVFSN